MFRTYRDASFPALDPALTRSVDPASGAVTYTLDTGIVAKPNLAHRISVSTFNVDAQDSAPGIAQATWTSADITTSSTA